MADVKWIKITTDIFDDEKILLIESMPSADSVIVIWFKLLTFAGKQNNDGVFLMSNRIAYTDEMLSSIFRRDVNTVRMALNVFEQFGMIEIVDNVITIPNWNKHQTLDAYEKKKQRDRLYQAERRAAQKALVAKSSDTSLDTSSDVAVSEEEREEEKEKEKESKKKNKKAKAYSDDSELNQALLSFVEFRKGIKKPMTDHAVDLLIKKLNGMTSYIPEQIEIINQSIVNGWQGVFPLKNEQAQAVKQQKGYRKQTKADELDDFYAMAAQFGEGD
jgi:predicted phage replisome organizer